MIKYAMQTNSEESNNLQNIIWNGDIRKDDVQKASDIPVNQFLQQKVINIYIS